MQKSLGARQLGKTTPDRSIMDCCQFRFSACNPSTTIMSTEPGGAQNALAMLFVMLPETSWTFLFSCRGKIKIRMQASQHPHIARTPCRGHAEPLLLQLLCRALPAKAACTVRGTAGSAGLTAADCKTLGVMRPGTLPCTAGFWGERPD